MAILAKNPLRTISPEPAASFTMDLAERPAYAAALRWFGKERSWINEQHLAVCRIAAPTFLEQTRADWFRRQLTSLGWFAKIDRAGNVVGTFGRKESDPTLVVSAHLDTVLAPSRPEDVYLSPDGKLIGPGTSDNGSGLTALLALARLLGMSPDLQGLAASILLVANVGEEGEGNLSGMRYLCRQPLALSTIKAFLVLDGPSIEHVTTHALASRRYEISLSGPGGHSWNDYGTPNPIHVLSSLIHRFVGAADQIIKGFPDVPCSYNFGTLEGGTSINSIPSFAAAKLDLRSEDGAILDQLSSSLTAIVEQALEQTNRTSGSQRLTAKIREIGSRPGGRLAFDSQLLQVVQAVDSYFGIKSKLDCASTDANLPLSLGLPAVSVGAGGHGGGAHTHTEWYSPERRELGLQRILLILAALFESQSASGG